MVSASGSGQTTDVPAPEQWVQGRLTVFHADGTAEAHELRSERFSIGRMPPATLALNDPMVSRAHAVLLKRASAGWVLEDQGSRNGTWLRGQRTQRARLQPLDVFRIGSTVLVLEEGEWERGYPGVGSFCQYRLDREAARLGALPPRVLLHGDSGAGKEWQALRFAETLGLPTPQRIVCDRMTPALLNEWAEWTFAPDSPPQVLLLNDLSAIPPDLQRPLVSLLDDWEARGMGRNIVIFSCCNILLRETSRIPQVRTELQTRLSRVVVELSPLRERRADILPMVVRMLGLPSFESLLPDLREALLLWDWPGNVRELETVVARLRAGGDGRLDVRDLPAPMGDFLRKRQPAPRDPGEERAPRQEAPTMSREDLMSVARLAGGNVSEMSRLLNEHRNQVVRWLERAGLPTSKRGLRDLLGL